MGLTVGLGLVGLVLFAFPLLPPSAADSSAVYAAEKADQLDINMATADQLKTLPGIDEAYSKKITELRLSTRKDESGSHDSCAGSDSVIA